MPGAGGIQADLLRVSGVRTVFARCRLRFQIHIVELRNKDSTKERSSQLYKA